ncbi:hypothetical protein [Agromyces sp. NPDC058110]|uniref:hypothetical protein n=1 Tax=Agromyces sp. NPDC058110 TaxID=3346345 RepID=UPI0036D9AF83
MDQLPSRNDDSVARRIARLESAEKRCRYVGTGFAGLVLILSINELEAADFARSIMVTLIVFGVASLGISVVNVIDEAGKLRGQVINGGLAESDPAGAYDPHPHFWYVAGLVILAISAIVLIAATWVAVL